MTFCCLDRGFSLSLLLLSAIAISQYGLQCSSSAAFLFFSVSFLLSCAACQCLILNFNSSSLFLSWFLGFTFLLSYINSLQAAGTFLQGATWLLLGFLQLNALAFVLHETLNEIEQNAHWHSISSVRLFCFVLLRMNYFCSVWFFFEARRSSGTDQWNTLKSGYALDSLTRQIVDHCWFLTPCGFFQLNSFLVDKSGGPCPGMLPAASGAI